MKNGNRGSFGSDVRGLRDGRRNRDDRRMASQAVQPKNRKIQENWTDRG